MLWRKRKAPASQPPCDQSSPGCRERELEKAHAEADEALARVRRQKEEQQTIGEVIRKIRERNHLAEIFDDGMRA